jgi:thiol:disulfide interchange protein DsbA
MRPALVSLMAGLLLLTSGVQAQGFEEGVQYVPIRPQPPVTADDQVEVIEFFWYGCPACMDFEPHIKQWAANRADNVGFAQMPVMFGGQADLLAQVYYALESMGELGRLHERIFDAFHGDKVPLGNRAEVDAFLTANGVDLEAFDAAMKSFAVAAKINRAQALMRRYGVRSVPTLVIDGRYRSGSGFRSYEEMTEVIDHVVAKVLDQRSQQARTE